jgi:hypothetical protein
LKAVLEEALEALRETGEYNDLLEKWNLGPAALE